MVLHIGIFGGKFDDTNRIIKRHESKDGQHNGQMFEYTKLVERGTDNTVANSLTITKGYAEVINRRKTMVDIKRTKLQTTVDKTYT